jgi:hypothetical protein
MARGRKTGGRKKGTPNKRTSVLATKAEAAVAGAGGEQPLDYLLRIMRDPSTEPHRRDAAAKAAAPYIHPQLQAVAHRMLDSDGEPLTPTINLTINPPVAIEPPKPKLNHNEPTDGEAVQ